MSIAPPPNPIGSDLRNLGEPMPTQLWAEDLEARDAELLRLGAQVSAIGAAVTAMQSGGVGVLTRDATGRIPSPVTGVLRDEAGHIIVP